MALWIFLSYTVLSIIINVYVNPAYISTERVTDFRQENIKLANYSETLLSPDITIWRKENSSQKCSDLQFQVTIRPGSGQSTDKNMSFPFSNLY